MFRLLKSPAFSGILIVAIASSSMFVSPAYSETDDQSISQDQFSRPFFNSEQKSSADKTLAVKSASTKGTSNTSSSSSFSQNNKHFPKKSDKTVYDRYQPVIQKVKGSK